MFEQVEQNPNFPEMEKKLLDHWYKNGVVKKYLKKNNPPSLKLRRAKKYFSFLDGPITANNPMGVHHAWGRTYKDLWPRFYNLLGYKQRFQNGFDCQGLWVEVEVEKELKLHSKKDIENIVPGNPKASIAKFVQLCKDRVKKYSDIQTEQSKRLGYFADWENSYFTMSDDNNYMIWLFLKKCFDNGWIYKGHESVPWCPRCQTAISQHEMLTEDYKEVVHESIILEFKILNSKFEAPNKSQIRNSKIRNEYLLVWTTTPWTIPANIAVAVDAKLDYSLVEGMSGDLFWVASDLVKSIFNKNNAVGVGHARPVQNISVEVGHARPVQNISVGVDRDRSQYKILKTVKGKELVGLKYEGPFDNLPAVAKVAKENPKTFHTVIATDNLIMPISTTEGTGLVHTAVSAGTEDFMLGKKLGLPMIPVINDDASYMEGLGFLTGKNAKKHPRLILDYLQEEDKKGHDCVFSIFNYKHRYPACWRCKAELVWKVADEWYIAMDLSPLQCQMSNVKCQKEKQNTETLRQRMIKVAKSIKWMPEFGLERELDWLKNMHDWLISKKNRYWGLALPIYECQKCGSFEVIGSKEELKKRAVKGWDKFEGHSPHKPFVDEIKIKCAKCQNLVSRIEDVGNPWLDAGIVPYSTISKDNKSKPLYLEDKKEWQKWAPADFITESFPGQFKNWFYALIAESTVLENMPPFKTVLGFGTLVGEDGRPMHKSWGNSIEFNEGADKIGVDVMRWMFARQNPADNMLFGYKKADEVRRQFYLMLWNVYKFFIEYSNLDKWELKSQRANFLSHESLTPNMSKHVGVPSKAKKIVSASIFKLNNILDKWILNRLVWLIDNSEKNYREFNAQAVTVDTEKFVSDLSTWYIRRSRNRVWNNSNNKDDKQEFYQTLYTVLINLSIILSPIMPFITEVIYTNLVGEESVHLSTWPKLNSEFIIHNSELNTNMEVVRKIVEAGHRARKENQLKVRQPLAKAVVNLPKSMKLESDDYLELIMADLNVKKVEIKNIDTDLITVKFDTKLTPELIHEGKVRGLIRQIQALRKEQGKKPHEKVNLVIPEEFKADVEFIKIRVMVDKISFGKETRLV